MLKFIKNILNSSQTMTLIGFIVTILVAVITSLLTYKVNQKKTTSEYFKNEGIKNQKLLLLFWTSIFIYGDFDKAIEKFKKEAKLDKQIDTVGVINEIIEESVLYSSKKTIKAISTYQKNVYKNAKESNIHVEESNDEDDKKNSDYKMMKNIVLPLRVAKRMKYDFTGEKININDIIQIKVNDFTLKRKIFSTIIIIEYFIKEEMWKILSLLSIILMVIFVI